ncbi:zinc finger protein 180-like [Cololabis saira]|uniref:zinc finger protein 180-like n=1 Tax=Cololabis saira TaxID=129043 RepID=UPI002AD22614|nr:zinc finger protein 180-like [Cololabis saira]
MSKVNHLREFIGQRLTAAAVEIFSEFEKTILEYEEELDRQRRLLDLAWKPEIRLNRIDLPQENVCKVEEDGVFSDQHLDNLQEMKQEDVEVDVSLVNLADVKVENGEPGPDRGQLLLHTSPEAQNEDEEGTESLHLDSSKTADLEPMRRHGDHEDTAVPSVSNCKSKLTRTSSGKRPHLCNTCGKTFTYLSTFKRHITIHTGEKAYVCNTCGKSYRQRSHLVVHSRTHTGEKPYLCNTCGISFIKLSDLKQHITTHTHGREALRLEHMWKKFQASFHPVGSLEDPHRSKAVPVQDLRFVINEPHVVASVLKRFNPHWVEEGQDELKKRGTVGGQSV